MRNIHIGSALKEDSSSGCNGSALKGTLLLPFNSVPSAARELQLEDRQPCKMSVI